MDDNQDTRERTRKREEAAAPATAESADVSPDGRPAPPEERADARVRAMPVIDQPPGDAQPPEVAGHDD